jgi:tRNA threonylcarbamoyladenosine biosynthesis protein TsaE
MKSPITYISALPSEMLQIAQSIHAAFPAQKVFILNGDLGSGKTTFVKAFAKAIGIEEEISSPTFSIVHEYGEEGKAKIYHFDLYRLKNEQELYQIGFEEYLERGAYVFIEWPELAKNFLPDNYVSLSFTSENENTRRIICSIVNK